MSTTSVSRAATTGLVGGALWALMPVIWAMADLETLERGSLSFVAVIAAYWIVGVLPPALIVVGITALRRFLGADAGRPGRTGMALAAVGLAAMTLGNGIELGSLTLGGSEVAAGHAIFLVGFLVSIVGGILTGIVVFRRRREGLFRAAGLLLILALPLGVGLMMLGGALLPDSNAGFWAAIAVPTGIAWVLLGRAMTPAAAPEPVATGLV